MISEGQRASAPPPTFPSDVVSTSKMWLQRLRLSLGPLRPRKPLGRRPAPPPPPNIKQQLVAAHTHPPTPRHEVSNLNAQMSTRQSSRLQYRIRFKRNGNPHLHHFSGNNKKKKKIPRKYSANEEPTHKSSGRTSLRTYPRLSWIFR